MGGSFNPKDMLFIGDHYPISMVETLYYIYTNCDIVYYVDVDVCILLSVCTRVFGIVLL